MTAILAEYLAGNRGPGPADPTRPRPNYGIAASLTDAVLQVVLTFRSGSTYCCYEPGCHLSLFDGKRWYGLRQRLAAAGIRPAPRLTLRLTGVVEDGAKFFDISRPDPVRRGGYAFTPVQGLRYCETAVEAAPPT